MPLAVCLIADPHRAPLETGLAERAGRALKAAPRWLAEAEACDFEVAEGEPAKLVARVRAELGPAPLDVAVVDSRERVKRLLVSDMDSTIITVECIDELADTLGIKAEVAAITRRAMNGELDFPAALKHRVALLEGLPVQVLEEVHRERVRLMPGARTLVQTMRAMGAVTALVSGGFTEFVERVREEAGFDLAEANRLEVEGGRLTGRVLEPIRDASSKLAMLRELTRTHGLRAEQTLAVGDGANDLAMIAAAGLGVAFRAHPRVARATRVAINTGDLTALLYLQGIPKDAFVV
jgi:phosphoserine phosphatase